MNNRKSIQALRASLLYGLVALAIIFISNTLIPGTHAAGWQLVFRCSAFAILPAAILFIVLNRVLQREQREAAQLRIAEEALRERDKQYRKVVELSADGLFVVQDDKFVLLNPSAVKILGAGAAEQLLGKSVYDFIHPDFRTIIRARMQELSKSESVLPPLEQKLLRLDGSTLEVQSTSIPMQFNGLPACLVSVRDISRARKLEEQFHHAQKMEAVGQLAGGVAHEFNNILTAIRMQADLLRLDGNLAPAQVESINDITIAAERAGHLTRQLLTFGRRQLLHPRDMDLNEAISNFSKIMARVLGENIRMQVIFSPTPLIIHADPGMVDQILMNLSINSRDVMPNGGRLVIETSAVDLDENSFAQIPHARPGSFACLCVSDSGPGIAPDILPHIFEPFFTTKDVGLGSGLGLAAVFGIVQQHSGWINVQSEPGKGAAFHIFIPRLQKTTAEPISRNMSLLPGGSETILVVEDEAVVRNLVRNTLSRLGYDILEAPDGPAALRIWDQNHHDIRLLLTDMVMPEGMSGRELAERLLARKPTLKVIYTSGYSADATSPDFPLEDGVNFLAKPFEAHQLAQTIRKRLDER